MDSPDPADGSIADKEGEGDGAEFVCLKRYLVGSEPPLERA